MPVLFALFAIVGLAISTEDRSTFRAEQELLETDNTQSGERDEADDGSGPNPPDNDTPPGAPVQSQGGSPEVEASPPSDPGTDSADTDASDTDIDEGSTDEGSTDEGSTDDEGADSSGDSGAEEQPALPWPALLAAVAILAILIGLATYLARRRSQDDPFGVDFVGPNGIPADRFEEFLRMLSNDPVPSRAVRLAFLAAERGLENLPARHPTDTPFEWVDQVSQDRPDVAKPLRSLAHRFATTRFADAEATPHERDAAVAELRGIEVLSRTGAPVERDQTADEPVPA